MRGCQPDVVGLSDAHNADRVAAQGEEGGKGDGRDKVEQNEELGGTS